MSSKSKLKKLQLPKSSRMKTNPQISNFFSTPNSEECTSSLLSEFSKPTPQLQENSNENSTSSWTSNDIVLIVSDDEDDNKICNNNDALNSKLAVKEELPENSDNKIPRKTVISKFFNNSIHDDSDFENPPPPTKPIKSTKPKTIKSKSIVKIKKKKQTTIKSAFVKNEEIFSELMAQHSIADDVNPDELQMALAISMSEATTSSICQDDDSKESLSCCSGNSNKIRDRLQEYGFKTNCKTGDYDISYFLPGKKKAKWANKFTALTLRNPERQIQKLNNKIDKLFNDQNLVQKEKNPVNENKKDFLISSNYLLQLKSGNVTTKLEIEFSATDSLKMFYIEELFESTAAKVGHLMKDLNEIPGRDFSPKKNISPKTDKATGDNAILENKEIYQEKLETNFLKSENILNDINFNLYNFISKTSETTDFQSEIEDSLLSPQHKRAKKDNILLTPPKLSNKEIEDRFSSPDLFADFEMNTSKEKNDSHNDKISSILATNCKTNISTYENFSSDEVKTFHDENESTEAGLTKNYSNAINTTSTFLSNSFTDDQLIDLTQDIENKTDSNITLNNSQQKSVESIKNNEIFNNTQVNDTQDDLNDDCIILSDDEVNYSIKITNKTMNYDTNIDLTLSSSSDIDEELENPNTQENDDCNIKNFSFINLIEDNVNIDDKIINISNKKENCNVVDDKNASYMDFLDENEIDEITPVQSPFKSQSELSEANQELKFISNSSFSEFLIPTKITPTKLFTNQSKISPNLSYFVNKTCNSSRKLEFASVDTMCNKSLEIDSEDDENSFDLTKLRAKFGIKEINKRKTINCRKTLSESCIASTKSDGSDGENLKLKKFSSSVKFKEFVDEEDDEYFSDMDEIDKLVHDNQPKTTLLKNPVGIEKLLTADITITPTSSTCKEVPTNPSINFDKNPKQITSNGRTYLVNTQNIPSKPDYKRMDSPTRLKELHKYGLKPLKKKQAVIMLEYIYNQTHPIIVNNNSQETFEDYMEENRDIINTQNKIINSEIENKINKKFNNFKLKDCCGSKLLQDCGYTFGENNDEIFIFQTNISKKILTALLPLHVAWYNLIQSSYKLNEAVLHYEPIDLQEIYLFLKNIGYRYDPKDIKKFFDNRCIIFRYDLNQDPNTNRHMKKKKSSFTLSQNSKQMNFDWLL